jgi:hypothetical protein
MHDDDTPWRDPTPTRERPTGLGACRFAATAREAAFRVQAPNALPREAAVIALDADALRLVEALGTELSPGARVLRLGPQPETGSDDVILAEPGGEPRLASEEIPGRDLVVLVATTAEAWRAAETIGRLARARGVMTAGVVLGEGAEPVLRELRPAASVLVHAADADYLGAMLSALRA